MFPTVITRLLLVTATAGMLSGCLGNRAPSVSTTSRAINVPDLVNEDGSGSGQQVVAADCSLQITPETITFTPQRFLTNIAKQQALFVINNNEPYAITEVTVDMPSNGHLDFQGRMTNKGSGVVRFKDCAVVIQVDGKLVNLDQDRFAELRDVVVPPGASITFTIPGPATKQVQQDSLVVLGLYDVLVAGTHTTFEARFVSRLRSVELKQVTRTSRRSMTPQEAVSVNSEVAADRRRMIAALGAIGTSSQTHIE